jgi:hypothetical protein
VHRYLWGARRHYLVHGRHYADVRRGRQPGVDDDVDPPGLVRGPSRELDHVHGAGYER